MLGKQWLNRYLRHAGGSMIERCGDRQRKCDGLRKWPFHLFVESLPVMLQVALLLLACGLCLYMSSVNTPIAYTLISLTCLGVLFYIGIVLAGASSYECPFQTPASLPLRVLWTKVGPRLISVVLPIITALFIMGGVFRGHVLSRLSLVGARRRFSSLSEGIRRGLLRIGLCLPPTGLNTHPRSLHPPLPTTRQPSHSPISQEVVPWFSPGELAKVQMKNTSDVRCVSWVIKNITDPEALDAAIRRAGMIRWFDGGTDMEPPYDLLVSIFHACFGSDWEVYPGSRERAYYSGRAILWIHTLAMCKSRTFPLPAALYRATGFEDLQKLLQVLPVMSAEERFGLLLVPNSKCTPSHSQWISNVLLHLSWAKIAPNNFWLRHHRRLIDKVAIPLDASLNYLLMCCNLLGSMLVEEEVMRIEDKSCDFSRPYPSSCSRIIR